MKKILIVSDTHGYDDNMWRAIDKEAPFDMFIHCGDLEDRLSSITYKLDCPIHAVSGNNDYSSELPRIKTFNIGRHKVLLVHGHHHRLYGDRSALYYLAMENDCDIVMFGHLHVPIVEQSEGIWLVNPGSLTYPRQENRRPSYIVMTADDKGEVGFEVKFL